MRLNFTKGLAMDIAGSISPDSGDKISDDVWHKVLASSDNFAPIKFAEITNPGTGDKVKMSAPKNKLAEFAIDGARHGIIWLPVHAFELGYEGVGAEFQRAVDSLAEIIGGPVAPY